MSMSVTQQIITALLAVLATLLSRFLPFWLFSEDKETPAYIQYLGKALPSAVFAMLVVYCYRTIEWMGPTHGAPEIIASVVAVVLHLLKRNMFLTMLSATFVYMCLVQFVF